MTPDTISENPTPTPILEEIKNHETIFQGYKLAFDVAFVLAEAGDDGEYLSLNDVVSYLDDPSNYDCEDAKELNDHVKEVIKTFNKRFTKHGFVIRKNKDGFFKLDKADKKEIKKAAKIAPKKTSIKKPRRKYKKTPYERKLSIPSEKLRTNITDETNRKIKLSTIYTEHDEGGRITSGDIISRLLTNNYPEEFEEIVEQIRTELRITVLPNTVRNKGIRIEKHPETAKMIYELANELQTTLPTVIECIAYSLPMLEEKDGEWEWVESVR